MNPREKGWNLPPLEAALFSKAYEFFVVSAQGFKRGLVSEVGRAYTTQGE